MSNRGQKATTRQARRAQQRRQRAGGNQGGTGAGGRGRTVLLAAAVAIALALVASFAVHQATARTSSSATPNLANIVGPKVDGIGCDNKGAAYHVHAHVTVLVNGRPWQFNSDDGHLYSGDCDYWLHRHPDENGIIHIEGPHVIHPTLKSWFDIVAKTSGSQAVPPITPKAGQERKVWVNGRLYNGDPLKITLVNHTDITIEVGSHFSRPTAFNFAHYQL